MEHEIKDRSLTDLASGQEERSNWSAASELYAKALEQTSDNDVHRIGDLLQRRGYALHMAALQSDSSGEFEKRTNAAVSCYEKAAEAYKGASEPWTPGKGAHCNAMIAYLHYWLAVDHSKKKQFSNEAWNRAKEALGIFEAAGKSMDFASVFEQLSYAAAFSYNYDGEAEGRENKLKEALSYAEKSIRYLSASGKRSALAKAHARATGLLVAQAHDFAVYSSKDRVDQEAWDHWLKARELSEDAALEEIPFVIILQSWPAACSPDERNVIYSKGKAVSEKTGNQFVIGCVMDGLAQRKFATAFSTDDSREVEKLCKEGFEAARISADNLARVRFISPNVIGVWVPAAEAGYCYSFASLKKDPAEKRELLIRAHDLCREQLKLAKESGYPDVECAAQFMLGSILNDLGKTESSIDMKRTYIEHAISHLAEAIEGDRRIHPNSFLPQGMDLLNLAAAHYELAQITVNPSAKKKVLEEAILRKEESLDLCEKELICTQASNPDISGEIGNGYHTMGDWVSEFCVMSGDLSCLPKVARCFEKAVEWYTKAGLYSQSAECNWEAAEAYDKLGEFRKASERFELAAQNYSKAAESIPRLKEFYADYSIYMRAWSEIELASYHHLRQEPGQAKEHYENASAMHKSSRRWSYLATNYSAWAEVEHAEDLSRSERFEDAMKAFEEGARLFQESKNALHGQISKIDDADEKQLARDLERAADLRRDYCSARIVVEKARLFDKEGDVSACSDKYGEASELFEKMSQALESDRDKKEIQLMATLSRAWQAMAKAEVETSPAYYDAASELFDKAKDLSTGEKAKMLVAGHSRFCKALGTGTRFIESGDNALHQEAVKHMESAADFYLKSDHQKESDFAKASKLLFDGYVHMGKASAEEDQEKKAKLYMMAEKVLHTSADAYEKAKQPSKKDQVLKLLEKVKEERELALSLTKVIRAPDVFSSTTAFPSPVPSHETAAGREKFEHADIQVTLIAHPKRLHVGEQIDIEVEMTNAGKGLARLIKIEGIVPKGFEVIEKPEGCRIEHEHLTLKNKSIDALGTEIVKLILKPTSKGIYSLKPHLHYVDESGARKDRFADLIEITVSEMGLAGWLKGPDKKR